MGEHQLSDTPVVRFEFEAEKVEINTFELAMLAELAKRRPTADIRVTDDGTNNKKVYVGPYYREQDRYWLHPDGTIGIHEKEHDMENGGDWRPA